MIFEINKDTRYNSGIYEIVNTINDHRYIGSAYRLYSRFLVHKSKLLKGIHENQHLQRAFDKYGKESFAFRLLTFCELDDIHHQEQQYLNKYFGEECYNINDKVDIRCMNKRLTKIYSLLSPDNKEYTFNGNKRDIARQVGVLMNIDQNTAYDGLNAVLSGKRKHFRGWRTLQNKDFDWNAKRKVNYATKQWNIDLRSPSGEVFHIDRNLQKFCKEQNIENPSTIHNLITRKTRYVNGWSLFVENELPPMQKNAKEYNIKLKAPDGQIYGPIRNLTKFCRDQKVNISGLQRLIWKQRESYNGWIIMENL